MVWGAIIAAGVGIATSVIQGNEQRSAADAANDENEKIAKDRYKRDLKEWEIDYLTLISNYSWEQAQTEAARYQDAVQKADYEANQSRVIETALLNMELNNEAVYDEFVTSEQLRALQDELTFDNEVDKQRLQFTQTVDDINQLGAELLNRRNQQLDDVGIGLARSNVELLQSINQRESFRQDRVRAKNQLDISRGQIQEAYRLGSAQERQSYRQGFGQEVAKYRLAADQQRRTFNQRVAQEKGKVSLGVAQQQRNFNVGRNAAIDKRDLEIRGINIKQGLDLAGAELDYLDANAQRQLKAAESNAASMRAAADYMVSINQRAQQANEIVRAQENAGLEIQENILISERLDTIKRDAQYITSIVDGAATKASTVARGGGSNSAKRAALDSMMAYGRSYGELKALQDQRRARLSDYNADLAGPVAEQLAQIATTIGGEADRIKYTSDQNLLKNEGFALQKQQLKADLALDKLGINRQARYGRQAARTNFSNDMAELRSTRRNNIGNLRQTGRFNTQNLRQTRVQNIQGLRQTRNINIQNLQQKRNQNVASLQQKRDFDYQDVQMKTKELLSTARTNIRKTNLDIRDTRLDKRGLIQDRGAAKQDYRTGIKGLRNDQKANLRNYNLNTEFLLDNFNQLTVPGYELARREGERKWTENVESTYNTVKAASRPYREAIILDPREPIAGLKPEKGQFTEVRGPSWGSIAARGFMAGVQGAMSMSYTNSNGELEFR